MRAFILSFALAFSLTACADSAEQNAIDEGAPAGDMEDVIGDGEIIDEPGEPEGNMFMSYDADGDGMVNEAEYGDGVNFGGAAMADYDTDGDGMISQAEYDAYQIANPVDAMMEEETTM